MDVSQCDCPAKFPPDPKNLTCLTSPQTCYQACGNPPIRIQSRAQLTTCNSGCVSSNSDCNGCYIWFHSLCGCIRDLQSPNPKANCIPDKKITPGKASPPVWMVTSRGDLITTTQLLPGILQLHTAPDADGGFQLGQKTLRSGHPEQEYNRANGTLAINSALTRSEEQIHIHLCQNPASSTRDLLSGLNRSDYKVLKWVQFPPGFKSGSAMYCRVSPSPGGEVDVATDILRVLQTTMACDIYNVGGGVVTDRHDYSWSCVTSGSRSAEEIFCHT
ncbi:hypothetical protein N7517_000884 [Penicillium concentricum]|uniref:Uncharacterized protein n=1 Tax=Penicillium concentricum TaxID=293559 RepID=A0A9W9VHZ8_9EURO|nr:uncharacterized protein N7517_000884 [Penicillium concentricum]KAJ5382973.1 hypothetical protein N7517_000884 [Penicillium concentricum]